MFTRYRFAYQMLMFFAVVDFTVAFSLGTSPASRYISFGKGFVTRMLPGWVLIPLLWAGYLAFQITKRRVDRPFSAIRRMLYRERHWLGRGMLFMLVILFLARSFTSYKAAIPTYVPFYADPWLADLDIAIFGTDPWRLTHAWIGPWGTMVLDRIYGLWFLIMMLYIGWFCFSRNQVLQIRGLLTYLLSWALLGNLCAVLLSSVGPCFYEEFYGDDRFAPMMAELQNSHTEYTLFAFKAMKFLIKSIGEENFGAGISAMPSLHVAIAFMCFLVAWEYGRHTWAKVAGLLFYVAIAVGSVHLGWHYAVDGIVSTIVTGAIWWATGRFMRWVERREASGMHHTASRVRSAADLQAS